MSDDNREPYRTTAPGELARLARGTIPFYTDAHAARMVRRLADVVDALVAELADALEAATTQVQRQWERAQKAETALHSDAERRRVIDHASMLVGLEAQRAEAAEKERDEARAAIKRAIEDLDGPLSASDKSHVLRALRAALGEEKSG